MKKYVTLFLALSAFFNLRAQSYPASAIPDSLKQNADMVVRLDERVTEIKSPGRIIEREHHVYTVLNENADRYATYKTGYDKFTSINYVNATLYDASGKELKHFRKKDMQDFASESAESLVTDVRYKIASFSCHTYPYTVDFEEEDEIESALRIHGWSLSRSVKISLECSRYSII
ncbi:MAG TPA: DUF3857 domain-containing protein, partial [Puia sp.]